LTVTRRGASSFAECGLRRTLSPWSSARKPPGSGGFLRTVGRPASAILENDGARASGLRGDDRLVVAQRLEVLEIRLVRLKEFRVLLERRSSRRRLRVIDELCRRRRCDRHDVVIAHRYSCRRDGLA